MAIHASARKAARQSEKHKEHNRSVRADARTQMASLRKMITDGVKDKQKLLTQLTLVQGTLMRAAHRKMFKKETASRYVGSLSRAIHKAVSASK